MRYFLLFWLLPVGFLVAWLQLSANDVSFGTVFFSRQMYDLVFGIYAEILGVDPAILPPMIYKALIVDTGILAAIVAFRRRKSIVAWINARRQPTPATAPISEIAAAGPIHPAE
jgi:hypothetical protein